MDMLTTIRTRRETAVRAMQLARPIEEFKADLVNRAARRSFAKALNQPGRRIIAELKQASPSRGRLIEEYCPTQLAREYEKAGAAALSVLTEPDFFLGSLEDLTRTKNACTLPVLQKDFVFDPYQIYQGALAGADAVLLIASMLNENELFMLYETAIELELEPVVEIHYESEIAIAKRLPSGTLIGINNRNLGTFRTDVQHALTLIDPILESGHKVIVFSGIHSNKDIDMFERKTKCFLVGEHLITASDRTRAMRQLLHNDSDTQSSKEYAADKHTALGARS